MLAFVRCCSLTNCKLAYCASFFTYPPTTSRAFLPCDVAKKFHSVSTLKSLLWQIRFMKLYFSIRRIKQLLNNFRFDLFFQKLYKLWINQMNWISIVYNFFLNQDMIHELHFFIFISLTDAKLLGWLPRGGMVFIAFLSKRIHHCPSILFSY